MQGSNISNRETPDLRCNILNLEVKSHKYKIPVETQNSPYMAYKNISKYEYQAVRVVTRSSTGGTCDEHSKLYGIIFQYYVK